jgi:aldehyde:ferredoxin oxidoreductase
MNEPIKTGPSKGELLKKADWDKMLDEYYGLHGWDPMTSWPTKNKLKEIGLHECIEKLDQAKKASKRGDES